MAYELGSTSSFGSTGNQTLSVTGFDPKYIKFWVGKKSGTDNTNHFCIGSADGTNQACISNFTDATGSTSRSSTSKVVSVFERVSGTITEVLAVNLVNMGTVGSNSFVLNTTITNTNYTVYFDIAG